MVARQDVYARINIWFLILINQFQVALGLRFNFFQRDFGNAIQVADEAHRAAFWYQLLYVFVPLAFVAILSGLVEFFIASNFVLQWRRWMTASFTSRWLLHSMHYKLALGATEADNPDQRISQDVGGFINGTGTGIASGNAGIYNYTIQAISSATNLVSFSIILWGISDAMSAPIFGVGFPASCSGSRCSTRRPPPASPISSAAASRSSISASRRSRRTSASTSPASANTASRSRC